MPPINNSIYTGGYFDSRYMNPSINQQTGAFQLPSTAASSTSPTGSPTTGSATGTGGYSPGAAPNLDSLTTMINNLNLTAQKASNEGRIPNDPALEAKSSANIGSELAGQVPSDVINLLQQQAAERGIATGSPGSDNSNAAYLRALGLTSLGQEQTGQADLTRALARNPGARVFDPTSQLLTPAQAGGLNLESARNTLDWFRALQGGGSGGARGGGGGMPTTQDTATGVPSWFPTVGGTPSPVAPASTVGPDLSTLAGSAVDNTFNPNIPITDLPDVTAPAFDQSIFDPTGSGLFDPTSQNYNPFAGYA